MSSNIEKFTKRIKELEERCEDLDRRRRLGWRRYFLKERISLPKPCPKCGVGLLIIKPNEKGGVYAACSNFKTLCDYYVKEKKKSRYNNAYNLKYNER